MILLYQVPSFALKIQRESIPIYSIYIYMRITKVKLSLPLSFCPFRLPRGFRWKSGQCASLNSNAVTSGVKKDKENRFQKVQDYI